MDEESEQFRMLHNSGLSGHVARIGKMRNAYRILVGKFI
jgi:hypothetical protein